MYQTITNTILQNNVNRTPGCNINSQEKHKDEPLLGKQAEFMLFSSTLYEGTATLYEPMHASN